MRECFAVQVRGMLGSVCKVERSDVDDELEHEAAETQR